MNRNPKSKTQIERQLHERVEYHLFKSATWPADDDEVRAFLRILKELELLEGVQNKKT